MIPKSKRAAQAAAAKKPAAQSRPAPNTASTTSSTRSPQQFLAATSTLSIILSEPTIQPNKNKQFLPTLNIIFSQLHHHHTKSPFLSLTPGVAIIYSRLIGWFLSRAKNINEVDVDTLALVTQIMSYVIPIPLKSPTKPTTPNAANLPPPTAGNNKQRQKQQKQQEQAPPSPTETVQHHLFCHLLKEEGTESLSAVLFKSRFLTPLLSIISTLVAPLRITASTQSNIIAKGPIVSSLLTIIQQAVQWATFIKTHTPKESPLPLVELITEPAPLYISLGTVFNAYVNDWSLKTRSQAEIIGMIVEIIALLIGYYSPPEKDDNDNSEQSSDEPETIVENETQAQTQHINTSDDAIRSLCGIIFNILCSIITHKIQHKPHPFLTIFANPSSSTSDQPASATGNNPSEQTTQIFNTITHQVFNIAHYLSVCYVNWFAARSIDAMPPSEQIALQLAAINPWRDYITEDLFKLFCLWLRHLDRMNAISVDDEQQSAVRRIMGVLMSGARCEMIRIFTSGYFELLISLVWDVPDNGQGVGKLRSSAVNATTPEQKTQGEQGFARQQTVEINRLSFFTLSLDIFIMWCSMGYSSRYLLLNQYHFIDVLNGVLINKVLPIDQIMRKQGSVVEKIALFMKNISAAIGFYYEFDYTMYFHMCGFGAFPTLKESQLSYLGLTASQVLTDPKLEKGFEQRIADDVYAVFIYDLYHRFQFSTLFASLYPALCLYYVWPAVPDINTITSGTNPTTTTPETEKAVVQQRSAAFDQDMDKMIAYAMIEGGIQQQNNNFIIASDLITFTTFAPLYHLYSYLPGHFTHSNIANRLGNVGLTSASPLDQVLSPIQLAGFDVLFGKLPSSQGAQFDLESLSASFEQVLKDHTKFLLIGLKQPNRSNDNPQIVMSKYFNGDESSTPEQEVKIDALVAQVVQFTHSLLTQSQDIIPVELHFEGFRANYATVDDFLAKCFPLFIDQWTTTTK